MGVYHNYCVNNHKSRVRFSNKCCKLFTGGGRLILKNIHYTVLDHFMRTTYFSGILERNIVLSGTLCFFLKTIQTLDLK